jgi:hypothetical protein
MRLNRLGWGVVAAGVGFITLAVVAPLAERYFGPLSSRISITTAALTAGAVFWLADHFGMVSAPYSSNTLDLRPTPTLVDARRRALPPVPPTTGQSALSEFCRYLWTIATSLHRRERR